MAYKNLFKTIENCDNYRKQLFRHALLNANTNNCTICLKSQHSMKVQYIGCSNYNCLIINGEPVKCLKKYKIQTCLKDKIFIGKIRLFESGEHNSHVDSNTTYGIKKRLFNILFCKAKFS